MARLMVENNTREFDPSQFKDRYQDALHEIIRGRWKGKRLLWPGAEPGKVVDIMEALRRSLGQTKTSSKTRRKPPAKSVKAVEQSQRKKRA